MASIQQTKTGLTVKWRLGGKRTGAPQTLTLPWPASGRTEGVQKIAEQVAGYVKDRRHAVTRGQAYAAVVNPTGPAESAVPTLAAWYETYLADLRDANEIQPDTIARYGQVLAARAVPYLGHLRLTEITPDVIREWLRWLQRSGGKRRIGLGPETVRRSHAILHGCLGAAVPRHLPTNPAARPAGSRKRVAGLPKARPFEGMFLTKEELAAIQGHASPVLAPLMFTLARTGLRLGEALALRIQDVVLTGRRPLLRVRRALKPDGSYGDPKSAKSIRDVDISAEVVAVLEPLVAGRRADDLLFTAARGGRLSEDNLRNRHWLKAVAEAQRCLEHPPPPVPTFKNGRPRRKWRDDEVSTCSCPGRLTRAPRLHDLRHTHASLLIEAGWMPTQVQLRLGHASASITLDIYSHVWQRADNTHLAGVERLLAMVDGEAA